MTTIAMTGATGFLGRHARALLERRGDRVITVGRSAGADLAIDLTKACPSWSAAPAAPETLLHCAGVMAVTPESVLDSATMAANLLRDLPSSIAKLVLVSTAYVYAQSTTNVDEDTPPAPADVYAHTKLMVEQLFTGFARATRRDLVILRPCAIYGAGDPHRKAITAFIERAKRDEAPVLAGAVTSPRDYVHVDDAARAVAEATQLETTGAEVRIFNVCTGRAWSALDLARMIDRIKPSLGVAAPDTANDALGYRFDPTRAARELGFRAEVDLETALAALVAGRAIG